MGGTNDAINDNVSDVTKETTQSQVVQTVPGMETVVLKKPEENSKPVATSYLIWDGVKIENTEDTRRKFAEYVANIADGNGGSPWYDEIKQHIEQAAKDGTNIVFNTPSNTISFLDKDGNDIKIDWDSLNDRQDKRIQKERSWLGRVLDANTNSKVQRMAKDISKLGGFRRYLNNQSQESTTAVDPNLINLAWGGNKFFTYLKDENDEFIKDSAGNLKYDVNNPTNAELMRIVSRAKAWLSASEEDRKQFTLANEYNKGENLLSIYKADPTGFNQRLDAAIKRVIAGEKLLPEDLSMLELFGIITRPLTEEEIAANESNKLKKKWTDAGYGDIYDKANPLFSLDENGDLVLNEDSVDTIKTYGLSNLGGYELNDNWIDYLTGKNLYSSDLDWLKGYTLYNGKLYKTTSGATPDSKLAKILASSGFVKANQENRYTDAQKIINTLWGKPYEWNQYDDGFYSSFLWDKQQNAYRTNRRYRSANGMFTGLKNGQQILAYFDPGAERDYQGFVVDSGIRYAVTDRYGNIVGDLVGLTEQDLTDEGITRITREDGSQVNYGDDENLPFQQRRLARSNDMRIDNHVEAIVGANKEYGLYYNPMREPNRSDPKSWVVYYDSILGSGYLVPPMFGKALLGINKFNENNLKAILANPRMTEKFRNILTAIADHQHGVEFWSRWWNAGGASNIKTLCNFLGLNESQTDAIIDEIKEMKRSDRDVRSNNYKVNIDTIKEAFGYDEQVVSEKQGGNIPKFAPGGGFGKAVGTKGITQWNKTEIKDSRESQEFGAGDLGKIWNSLSAADRADIIGLGLDLGSIAASAAPLTGGVVGFGGTLAGLYADVKRDGLQIGDIGRAGLSTIFDIGSALPGLGIGAKAAKIATNVIKWAKPIAKILGAAGAVESIPLIEKLSSEGKLSAQEWHQLTLGVAGAINLARAGGPGKGTKTGDYKNINVKNKDIVTVKPKDGSSIPDLPELKFTSDQIRELNAISNPLARTARAREFAFEQLSANPKFTGKKRAELKSVLQNYDYEGSGLMDTVKIPVKTEVEFKSSDPAEASVKLTKEEIAEINASPDPAKAFNDKIKWKIGERYKTNLDEKNQEIANKFAYKPESLTTTSYTVKSNIKTIPDITLEKSDIETILSKKTPKEQQEAFVATIRTKSGDTTLDTIDKIKSKYSIDDFFEKRRGKFEWKHPINSFKNKEDSFVLKAEKERIEREVRGNGLKGAFGFRDWWNNVGTTRFFNNSRRLPTESDFITPTIVTSGTTAGATTKTGANWLPTFKRMANQSYWSPRPMKAGNLAFFGRIKDYEMDSVPESINDDNTTEPQIGIVTFKNGGDIRKYISGGSFFENAPKSLNFVDSALEYGKFANSMLASKKRQNMINEFYKDTPEQMSVQYNVPGFYDNGIVNQGDELLKDIYSKNSKVYTSDPTLANLTQRQNDELATTYQNKINTNLSKAISTQKEQADKYRNQNLENSITTKNINRQTRYKGAIQRHNADVTGLMERNQSIANLLTDKVTQVREWKNGFKNWKDKLSSAKYKIELQNILNKDSRYTDAQNAWLEYAKTNPNVSFENWISTVGINYKNNYQKALQEAQNATSLEQYRLDSDFSQFGIYGNKAREFYNGIYNNAAESGLIPSNANGGRVQTKVKKSKDIREIMWADQNKAVQKAIENLSKASQQVLLKMLK